MTLPFELEGDPEHQLAAAPGWREGIEWGHPRPGHPEGAVKFHIAEVLTNVERHAEDAEQRARLRLIALAHDSWKHLVDRTKPRHGENQHGRIARRQVEPMLHDLGVLDVIEWHDEAYNAWRLIERKRKWARAESRARDLAVRLGDELPLYMAFFRCDNETGSKGPASVLWFSATLEGDYLAPKDTTLSSER